MVVSLSSSMLSSSTLDIGGYAFMSIYNRLKIISQLAITLQLKEKNMWKINSRIFYLNSYEGLLRLHLEKIRIMRLIIIHFYHFEKQCEEPFSKYYDFPSINGLSFSITCTFKSLFWLVTYQLMPYFKFPNKSVLTRFLSTLPLYGWTVSIYSGQI